MKNKVLYINNHAKYWEGQAQYFSRSIKLYDLNLTDVQSDKAWAILEKPELSYEFWEMIFSFHVQEFEIQNPDYTIYQVGRSGGHLILVNKSTPCLPIINHNVCLSINDIYNLIRAFDKTVDNIIEDIKASLDSVTIEKKIEYVPQQIFYLVYN